jgi:hypothetical protein
LSGPMKERTMTPLSMNGWLLLENS